MHEVLFNNLSCIFDHYHNSTSLKTFIKVSEKFSSINYSHFSVGLEGKPAESLEKLPHAKTVHIA